MSRLILPQRFTSQPQNCTEPAAGYCDAVACAAVIGQDSRAASAVNGSPSRLVTPQGLGFTYPASAYHNIAHNYTGSVYTLIAVCRMTHSHSERHILDDDNVSSRGFQLRFVSFECQFIPFDASNTPGGITVSTNNIAGMTAYGAVVARARAGETRLDVANCGSSSGSLASIHALTGSMYVGNFKGSVVIGNSDGVLAYMVIPRFLSDAETKQVIDSPWQIFKAPSRQIWAPASEAPSGITGTFAANESGSDTSSSNGGVLIQGAAASSETGSDTAALTGKVLLQGSLAGAETGSDTAGATGKVTLTGTLAAIEAGADTAAAAGKVVIHGTALATETGTESVAVSGKVIVQGGAVAAEAGTDTLLASGSQQLHGAMAAVEAGGDSISSSGKVRVAGAVAAAEAPEAFAATGKILVQGAAAASESGADVLHGSGGQIVSGTLASAEIGSDSASASGKLIVRGLGGASESGSDSAAAAGQLWIHGTLNASEIVVDSCVIVGRVLVQGSVAANEVGIDTLTSNQPDKVAYLIGAARARSALQAKGRLIHALRASLHTYP